MAYFCMALILVVKKKYWLFNLPGILSYLVKHYLQKKYADAETPGGIGSFENKPPAEQKEKEFQFILNEIFSVNAKSTISSSRIS